MLDLILGNWVQKSHKDFFKRMNSRRELKTLKLVIPSTLKDQPNLVSIKIY